MHKNTPFQVDIKFTFKMHTHNTNMQATHTQMHTDMHMHPYTHIKHTWTHTQSGGNQITQEKKKPTDSQPYKKISPLQRGVSQTRYTLFDIWFLLSCWQLNTLATMPPTKHIYNSDISLVILLCNSTPTPLVYHAFSYISFRIKFKSYFRILFLITCFLLWSIINLIKIQVIIEHYF